MSEWQPPRSIVYGTDFSEQAVRAGDVAWRLADHFESKLAVLHAVDVPPMVMAYARDIDVVARDAASERLAQLRAEWEIQGLVVGARSRIGPAARVLVEEAEARHGDLIVVGTHGRAGSNRFFLGSVAEAVVRRAHCSVLTIEGSGDPANARSIVVGIDFSEGSEYTLRAAGRLAQGFGARLHAVHVLEHRLALPIKAEGHVPPDLLELAKEGAAERLSDLVARCVLGVDTSVEICDDVSYEGLAERASAHRADLLVVGAYGHRGFVGGMIGSTAERILRGAPCSVWAVRSPHELAARRAVLGAISDETVLIPAT